MSDCPTPRKIGYESRANAKRAINNFGSTRPKKPGCHMKIYLCDCGLWHLSSMTNRECRELRSALRRREARNA